MIKIRHRFTGNVIYTAPDATTLREAVEAAIRADADLADAYLRGADLADANLRGANLLGANLRGACLARADLARANLAHACLSDANLVDADLVGAYLVDANLSGANLSDANLARANLARANLAHACLSDANLVDAYLVGAYLVDAYLAGINLAGADLRDADLWGAYLVDVYLAGAHNVPSGVEQVDPPDPYERLTGDDAAVYARRARRAERYRRRHPDVPVVERLDRRILERIESGSGTLDMSQWHSETCETAHCRAGWAIVLAGEPGRKLERQHGPFIAGSMIYRASTGRVPHFFASDRCALEDIRRCAAEEVSGG